MASTTSPGCSTWTEWSLSVAIACRASGRSAASRAWPSRHAASKASAEKAGGTFGGSFTGFARETTKSGIGRRGSVSAASRILADAAIAEAPSREAIQTAMLPLIAERRAEIADICRRFGVSRRAVFGSAARGNDFEPARSDVDFLVAYEPAANAGLGDYIALRDELAAAVGRPVDRVVEGSVRNPFVRAGIERSAETVSGPRPARPISGTRGRARTRSHRSCAGGRAGVR